jgi:hypothetical protein
MHRLPGPLKGPGGRRPGFLEAPARKTGAGGRLILGATRKNGWGGRLVLSTARKNGQGGRLALGTARKTEQGGCLVVGVAQSPGGAGCPGVARLNFLSWVNEYVLKCTQDLRQDTSIFRESKNERPVAGCLLWIL